MKMAKSDSAMSFSRLMSRAELYHYLGIPKRVFLPGDDGPTREVMYEIERLLLAQANKIRELEERISRLEGAQEMVE